MSLTIKTFSGQAIEPFIEDVARLRIEIFRAFPYLYDGSFDYEEQYLRTYSQSANSLFVLVFDGERVVGASTGVPMEKADSAMQEPFLQQHYPVEQIFYFGESVLLSRYRGRGIGKQFFEKREAFARALDSQFTAFCAVERPTDHPLRPAGYRPLDGFWQKQGYEKQKELFTFYEWKDINEEQERAKKMVFWLKAL